MKFTLGWLKDHLDTDAPLDEIAAALTRIGLEVEAIQDRARALAPFVVGEILTAVQHPNADRLRVCTVATGSGEPVELVCGAPNARAGLRSAFARVGSIIPTSGETLKAGSIRGVVSNGMLCSARELGLGEEHDGIIELPADALPGQPIAPLLGLDDPVIDINLTPNRADCAGIRGIARDLAAAGLGRLKLLAAEPVAVAFASQDKVIVATSPTLSRIVVEDQAACPLFLGRLIRGVRNGPSPRWLAARLTAIGLRPISALVDITNYLTFDRCRPLHVFDAAKLRGNRLTVRPAHDGETLAALNGKTYLLAPGMTVIADAEGAESLGGIMGGARTGCTAETTEIVVECALFDPRRTAETGRALQINSDARYRFERGVDPEGALPGMEAATRMILDLCGGEPGAIVQAGEIPDWRRSVALSPARAQSLGGVTVAPGRQVEILSALGCAVEEPDGALTVQPPSWRADIEGEADLVEEILRIEGYDRIPVTPLPRLSVVTGPAVDAAQRRVILARRLLAMRGLDEAVTWSFMGSDDAGLFGGSAAFDLVNPISAELATMRPSILPNLIQAAARNAARGDPDVALFEVGPVFRETAGVTQAMEAAGIRAGQRERRHWTGAAKPVDAFDAKADALALLAALGVDADKVTTDANPPPWFHPGQAGVLRLGPNALGAFGVLHPDIQERLGLAGACAGFAIELDRVPLPRHKGPERPPLALSPFQPVRRDFAFLVNVAVPAERLVRAVRGAARDVARLAMIVDVALFDVYTGPGTEEGKMSLAIEVTLQPAERTLTDAEIEEIASRIVAAAAKETGATLRR